MKRLLLVLLIQSFACNAEIYNGDTDAIASPRDLSLNLIYSGVNDVSQTSSVRNYILTGVSGQSRLVTGTTTSLWIIENSTLDLDGTLTFSHGAIEIIGNCEINGSSDFSKIRFEASSLYITDGAELRIGPGVNFEYAPTSSIAKGIRFGSTSSKFTLEDATLTVSNKYGLNLIGGQLRIEGNSTVDNFFTENNVQYLDHVATFTEKALFLGNGPTSYGDCKLHITSGAKLTVKNAGIVYRNRGAGAFDGSDGKGSLVIDKGASFLIEDDVNFNTNGLTLDFSKLKSQNKGITVDSITSLGTVDFVGTTPYECKWNPNGKNFVVVGGSNDVSQVGLYTFDGNVFDNLETSTYVWIASGYGVISCDWTPDGKFLAVVGMSSGDDIGIYELLGDNTLNYIGGAAYGAGEDMFICKWSPDGRYLAVGGLKATNQIEIFKFSDGNSLVSIDIQAANTSWNFFESGDMPYEIAWTPDQKNIVVVGDTGNSSQIELHRFSETTTNTLIFAERYNYNATAADLAWSCDWSADGKYLAVVGDDSAATNGNQVQIFSLNGTSTLTSLGNWDYNAANAYIWECKWSPDSKVLAVVGYVTSGGNHITLYTFNGTSLSVAASVNFSTNPGTGYGAKDCDWTQDGKYLLVCGDTNGNDEVEIFKVDRAADDQNLSTFKDATLKMDKDLTLRDVNLKMK